MRDKGLWSFHLNSAEKGIAAALNLKTDPETTEETFYGLLAAELALRKGRIGKTIEIIMRAPGYEIKDVCELLLFSLRFGKDIGDDIRKEIESLNDT